MEIKDLLKSGQATPEQLMKDLQDQIDDAEKEIAAEKEQKAKEEQQNKNVREMREALVFSAIDYLMELGLIDKDADDAEIDKMCNTTCKNLESWEKALKDFQPMKKDFEKILHDDFDWEWHNWPDDTIINTFVRGLRF